MRLFFLNLYDFYTRGFTDVVSKLTVAIPIIPMVGVSHAKGCVSNVSHALLSVVVIRLIWGPIKPLNSGVGVLPYPFSGMFLTVSGIRSSTNPPLIFIVSSLQICLISFYNRIPWSVWIICVPNV